MNVLSILTSVAGVLAGRVKAAPWLIAFLAGLIVGIGTSWKVCDYFAEREAAKLALEAQETERRYRESERIQAQKTVDALERVATYERSTAVLLERVRSATAGANAGAGAGAADCAAKLGECRRLLEEGAGLVGEGISISNRLKN